MDADQAGDFKPQVKRVGDQPILPVEKDAIRPQMRCRPSRLIDTHSRQCKIARFAVAEIHQQHPFPLSGEQRNRASHLHFCIVGVCGDDHDIV